MSQEATDQEELGFQEEEVIKKNDQGCEKHAPILKEPQVIDFLGVNSKRVDKGSSSGVSGRMSDVDGCKMKQPVVEDERDDMELALALSVGDFSVLGRRNNSLVIREPEPGLKIQNHSPRSNERTDLRRKGKCKDGQDDNDPKRGCAFSKRTATHLQLALSYDSEKDTNIFCQVCNASLQGLGQYYQNRKICESHVKSGVEDIGDNTKKFCWQCSKLHPLTEFDEGKKTCRRKLAARREREAAKAKAKKEANEDGNK